MNFNSSKLLLSLIEYCNQEVLWNAYPFFVYPLCLQKCIDDEVAFYEVVKSHHKLAHLSLKHVNICPKARFGYILCIGVDPLILFHVIIYELGCSANMWYTVKHYPWKVFQKPNAINLCSCFKFIFVAAKLSFPTSTTKLLITRPPKLCPINIIRPPQSFWLLHM